ncbi:MAG: hypothetical protein CHACPFDD_00632 [Phycisphaerae bacterium]|nr:hypothetical protein [Phycisphaerae bacterium]
MNTWFVDSSHYFALLSESDAHHAIAKESQAIPHRVVTTTWVLTEVGDGLAAPHARGSFVALLRLLRSHATVEIVPASDTLFDRGCRYFEERPDQSWSLTDCISFVVMAERGLREALTSDRHFEQAGFVALLRRSGR